MAGLLAAVRLQACSAPMPPLDGASFEDCHRRVFPLVLAKCRRMLRGHADAMDVTQEVFLRLWKHRELRP